MTVKQKTIHVAALSMHYLNGVAIKTCRLVKKNFSCTLSVRFTASLRPIQRPWKVLRRKLRQSCCRSFKQLDPMTTTKKRVNYWTQTRRMRPSRKRQAIDKTQRSLIRINRCPALPFVRGTIHLLDTMMMSTPLYHTNMVTARRSTTVVRHTDRAKTFRQHLTINPVHTQFTSATTWDLPTRRAITRNKLDPFHQDIQ